MSAISFILTVFCTLESAAVGVEGQTLILGFDGSSGSRRAGDLESLGVRVTRTWCDGRLGLVRISPEADVSEAIAVLSELPWVRFVSPDDAVQLAEYVPNDPLFDSQWGLENSADTDINATLAWDQVTGSAETIIAILDTGVDYTHPDLYLGVFINTAEIPAAKLSQIADTNGNGFVDFDDLNDPANSGLTTDVNANGFVDAGDLTTADWKDGVDDDANGYVDDLTGWDSLSGDSDPMDAHGHGTHVAGIAAARGDNTLGVAGVNWRARILPERFHDGGGGLISDAIEAIEHAVLMGADVINLSWGIHSDSAALRDAITWAGQNGVVVCAAAGNHSANLDDPTSAYYPAAYQNLTNLLGVASVSANGNLSSFSSYGANSVEIAAPGDNILSTELGGDYVLWTGTSMSTPHVSGVVSLLAGLYPNESPAWIVDHVISTVRPVADLFDKTISGGTVDAYAAVNSPSLGPRVVQASPIGDVLGPTDRVTLTFDSRIDASTFTTADATLVGPAGGIAIVSVVSISDFVFELGFAEQTELGSYDLTVGPDVEDTLGRAMDQDRDGIVGEAIDDRYTATFRQVAPPQVYLSDNGDANYSAVGGWLTYNGGGAFGDFAYKSVGSGSEYATWTIAGLSAGDYEVAVTWDPYVNRASNAPFSVLDGASELGTVLVDQRQDPGSFAEDGVLWQDLGSFTITGSTLSVRLTDGAGPSGSYVIADAVRIERVGDLPDGPELEVSEGGVGLSDGSGTVDFGSTFVGTPVSRTVLVSNAGTQDLVLGALTLPAGYSLTAGFGATTLLPGESTDFTVQLDAASEGSYSGILSFDSNDVDENPFDLNLTGSVTVESEPVAEIAVSSGGTNVPDGTGSVSFGSTIVGSPVSRTISVSNTGTADLLLGPITLPAGFGLLADFGATTLVPGQTTDCVIELEAVSEGSYSGTVSFGTNDPDEDPFDFGVSGSVTEPAPPSQVTVLDDGEAGYSTTGAWATYGGAGNAGDFAYKSVGGGATATWTVGGLTPGEYAVSVTWQEYTNRPVDAPYTVVDEATGADLGTTAVDQRQVPSSFVEDGVSWEDLGVYQITGGSLTVRLSDGATPSGSYVIADAVRVERLGDLPEGPEVEVLVDGAALADGAGTVDFGSTLVGSPVSRTIAVHNVGTEDLVLGTITLPAGFGLLAGFGATTLSSGQSTDFVVELLAESEGSYSGIASFDSNDADESPFDITVLGSVTASPPPVTIVVVDDGDAGYSATGGWIPYGGAGNAGDFSYKGVGTGSETATWTVSGLTAGEYVVSVTWEAYTNRATDAPYTVLDGSAELGTVLVDQRQDPGSFAEDGVLWQDLGSFTITGSTLSVRLTDGAGPSGSYVIADAVRIERASQ